MQSDNEQNHLNVLSQFIEAIGIVVSFTSLNRNTFFLILNHLILLELNIYFDDFFSLLHLSNQR